MPIHAMDDGNKKGRWFSKSNQIVQIISINNNYSSNRWLHHSVTYTTNVKEKRERKKGGSLLLYN